MNGLKSERVGFLQSTQIGWTHPMSRTLLTWACVLSFVLLAVHLTGYLPEAAAWVVLAVLWLVPVVYAYRAGKRYFAGRDDVRRQLLRLWAEAAPSEAEKESRRRSLDDFPMLETAWVSAGLATAVVAPLVNIDGTPMVDLTNMDINGNPFGVVDMFADGGPFGGGMTDLVGSAHSMDDGFHSSFHGGMGGGGIGGSPFD